MLTKEIKDFVNSQKLGYVATVCPDGTPNLSPKGTVIVWDDDHIAFADINSPGTVRNLLSNPSVEINVVNIFHERDTVSRAGPRYFLKDQHSKLSCHIIGAAGSKHPIEHIVYIKVHSMALIFSPAYDAGLTENEIRERWVAYWTSINSINS